MDNLGPRPQQPWDELPLVALSATVLSLIQVVPLLKLDAAQIAFRGGQRTGWMSGLIRWLDSVVLRSLPEPFRLQYSQGPLISEDIILSLSQSLGLLEMEQPPPSNSVQLALPLFPTAPRCPECDSVLICDDHPHDAWDIGPSQATKTVLFRGRCSLCPVFVFPDRYELPTGNGIRQSYFHDATSLQVMEQKYVRREMAESIGNSVLLGHTPMSTIARHWNETFATRNPAGGLAIQLDHRAVMRTFILHHGILYSPPQSPFIIGPPGDGDESDSDDGSDVAAAEVDDEEYLMPLVSAALRLFPSQGLGHYRTYCIPGVEDHRCEECCHYRRVFQPEDAVRIDQMTPEELLAAHGRVTEDRTRIITSAGIDGVQDFAPKVRTFMPSLEASC